MQRVHLTTVDVSEQRVQPAEKRNEYIRLYSIRRHTKLKLVKQTLDFAFLYQVIVISLLEENATEANVFNSHAKKKRQKKDKKDNKKRPLMKNVKKENDKIIPHFPSKPIMS